MTVFGAILVILAFGAAGSAEQKEQQAPKKPKNSDIENIGNRDINKGSLNFLSLDREIALGRELARQVEQEQMLLNDTVINEYVNRVAQNIVRNSDAKFPFTIKVVDSDEINAFALPGGFFYVNSGLILAADDEAELAGVMAHEIAHVAARHGTEQQSKGQLVNYMAIPLIFVSGPVGYGIQQAVNLLLPITFLKFSRGMEEEADYLGVQYLYKTGYDPTAMVTFFEKLQAKERARPGSMSKLFSTHPPTGARIRKVENTITTILPPADRYVETTSEFNRVRALLARIQNDNPAPDHNRPSLRRKTRAPDPHDDDTLPAPAPEDPASHSGSNDATNSADGILRPPVPQ
jgi:predicted Zn-dependent protease